MVSNARGIVQQNKTRKMLQFAPNHFQNHVMHKSIQFQDEPGVAHAKGSTVAYITFLGLQQVCGLAISL